MVQGLYCRDTILRVKNKDFLQQVSKLIKEGATIGRHDFLPWRLAFTSTAGILILETHVNSFYAVDIVQPLW
jgi:hypothetical protein